MQYLRFDLIFLLLAIITAFLTKRFALYHYQKIFPYFLLLMFLVEVTGEIYKQGGRHNVGLYNFFSIIEFLFFTRYFLDVLKGWQLKRVTRLLLILTPLGCLLNIFYLQGMGSFHTYTYAVGSILMATLGIIHLSQIYSTPEIQNPLKQPSFWVTSAIIFFFTTSVSIIGIFNYVAVLSAQIVQLSKTILLTINCLFYLLFIISFLCQKNSRKSILNL